MILEYKFILLKIFFFLNLICIFIFIIIFMIIMEIVLSICYCLVMFFLDNNLFLIDFCIINNCEIFILK